MFMLICLAKGWTVVRRKISAQGRMRLAAYMTAYAISWLVALIWFSALPHGYRRVYVLGTSAGYVVLANRYVAICGIACPHSTVAAAHCGVLARDLLLPPQYPDSSPSSGFGTHATQRTRTLLLLLVSTKHSFPDLHATSSALRSSAASL